LLDKEVEREEPRGIEGEKRRRFLERGNL